jgi:hypothetical protein
MGGGSWAWNIRQEIGNELNIRAGKFQIWMSEGRLVSIGSRGTCSIVDFKRYNWISWGDGCGVLGVG